MADKEPKKDYRNTSLSLLGSRLGLKYKVPEPRENQPSIESILDPEITGVSNQRAILGYNGGTY
jgi:hypothetical protein